MSRKLDKVSAFSVALTFAVTILSADGSGAVAQAITPQLVPLPVADAADPAILPAQLQQDPATPETSDSPPFDAGAAPTAAANPTLAEWVAEQPRSGEIPRELECMAGAIYFEAKSESLAGQLAVGRVIVNRARSGRFPASYCGVVFQRSQFSFVRGNAMPAINKASRGWQTAAAIARIAHEGSWTSPAEGALFFHAARVSPRWRLTRIARVDNHVFYR